MKKKTAQAYPEEMLAACRKGKPCDYGICDECPNIVGKVHDDESEDE